MSKYRLIKAEKDLWDKFVAETIYGNVFFCSQYFDYVGKNFEIIFLYKGEQIKAGIFLILDDDGTTCEVDDFIIYNGILFVHNEEQKEVKSKTERFEITEFIIHYLVNKFSKISISLIPEFEDLRPFLWHNYHSQNHKDKFSLELKYTSYLDISELFLKKQDEDTMLYKNMDSTRQSDLRKAKEGGVLLIETDDVNLFIEYYSALMAPQEIDVPNTELMRLKNLIMNILKNGIARMFAVKNNEGNITYITIFTIYKNRGCYLFGAGDKEVMKRYDGTFCIWESMKRLSELGVYEIDFEGVNSPMRGAFKLSFGGTLTSYYHVKKN